MGFINDGDSGYAWVNKSSYNIPVFETYYQSGGYVFPSGNQIGTIYPNEMYTAKSRNALISSNSNFCNEIRFRNSSGSRATGYIFGEPDTIGDPHPLSWYAYLDGQKMYHLYNSNGSSLVPSTTETIEGMPCKVFSVNSSTYMLNRDGSFHTSLYSGYKLATNQSTIGNSYPHLMLFQFVKTNISGAPWTRCYPNFSQKYGFVDLGFSTGSSPSNRPIR